jgi:hypothetical protein
MSDDEDKFRICQWCGCEELWPDEMSKNNPDQCEDCEREECSHATIDREYQGSTHNRVRFIEVCLKCDANREVLLYFHNRYPDRTEWVWD